MAWTYNPENLETSSKDEIRFIVGDTDPDYAYLQDEEIQFLLKDASSVKSAAVKALHRIIAKVAKEVDYRIGPESVSASDRLKNFKMTLEQLESELKDVSSMHFPEIHPHRPTFDIGMDDNGPDRVLDTCWNPYGPVNF